MIFRIAILGMMILSAGLTAPGQSRYLDRPVTLRMTSVTLESALMAIGKAGGFRFSYDAEQIPSGRTVTVNALDEKTSRVLQRLLGDSIRVREIGSHVILCKSVAAANKKLKHEPAPEIRGTVTGTPDRFPVQEATVYDVGTRRWVQTDADGSFRLVLPPGTRMAEISITKKGFRDTVLHGIGMPATRMEVTLRPEEPLAASWSSRPGLLNRSSTDSIPLVRWIVPRSILVNAGNMEDRTPVNWQVSLVPYLGTRGQITGSVTHRVSVNILSGYTGGVDGVEAGLLLNMVRNRVDGVQVSGICNITGGEVTGWQAAGLYNHDLADMHGVQICGGVNYVRETMSGVQIGCLLNNGRQVAGVQIAGLMNRAGLAVRGTQVAAVFNYAGTLRGVQLGLFNYARTVEKGIPIGFFSYVRQGYSRVEVSANELFYVNLAWKTGVTSFYNIFQAGVGDDLKMHLSYGLGSVIRLGRKVGISLDAYAGFVYHPRDTVYHGLLLKFNPSLEFRTGKRTAVFAGPAYNYFLWTKGKPSATRRGLSFYDFYSGSTERASYQMWLGGVAGFRF